jgi:hypothetical protein
MKTSARKRGYTFPLKIYIYIAISSTNTRLEGTNHITYHTLIQKKCQKINCQQKCIHKFIPTHLYAATEIQPISTPKILPLHNRAPGQCPCERPRPGSWDPAGPQRFCCRSQKKTMDSTGFLIFLAIWKDKFLAIWYFWISDIIWGARSCAIWIYAGGNWMNLANMRSWSNPGIPGKITAMQVTCQAHPWLLTFKTCCAKKRFTKPKW